MVINIWYCSNKPTNAGSLLMLIVLRNIPKTDKINESENIGCSTLKNVDNTFKELLLFPQSRLFHGMLHTPVTILQDLENWKYHVWSIPKYQDLIKKTMKKAIKYHTWWWFWFLLNNGGNIHFIYKTKNFSWIFIIC